MNDTPPTDRALVAAAIENRVAELATAVGAGIRGMALGMPEHLVEHIAELSVSLIASAFGSDIADDQIRTARREHTDALTGHIADEFDTISNGSTVDAWVIGTHLTAANGESGFAMLVSGTVDFMHQALADELVRRLVLERRRGGE